LLKLGKKLQEARSQAGYFFIREIVRPKYASPNKEADTGVQIAPLPPALLNRCHADESLLASIIIWKYVDHLPLYRQEECLAREG